MARCTKCGTVAPAMARFCPICGTAVGPAPPTNNAAPPSVNPNAAYTPRQPQPLAGQSAPTTYTAPNRNKAGLIAAIAGVACLGVAGFLLVKSGVLGAKPTAGNGAVIQSPATQAQAPLLSAPNTQAQAPVMAAPPVNAPPSNVIAPPGNPGNAMPEDVVEYLRWLKRFHAGLGDLNAQLEQVTLTIFPNMMQGIMNQVSEDDNQGQAKAPNPNDPTAKMSEITLKLNNAAALFQQKQPPNACAPLATAYRNSLTVQIQQVQSMVSMLGEITRSFANPDVNAGANDRMQKLTGLMQEKSSKSLSQNADALVLGSDTQLNSLRARYTNIPPDIDAGQFQIKPLNSGFDPSKLMGGGGSMPGLGM
jgi:hypothetical protein